MHITPVVFFATLVAAGSKFTPKESAKLGADIASYALKVDQSPQYSKILHEVNTIELPTGVPTGEEVLFPQVTNTVEFAQDPNKYLAQATPSWITLLPESERKEILAFQTSVILKEAHIVLSDLKIPATTTQSHSKSNSKSKSHSSASSKSTSITSSSSTSTSQTTTTATSSSSSVSANATSSTTGAAAQTAWASKAAGAAIAAAGFAAGFAIPLM